MFAVASGEQKQLNGAQQPGFFFFFSQKTALKWELIP